MRRVFCLLSFVVITAVGWSAGKMEADQGVITVTVLGTHAPGEDVAVAAWTAAMAPQNVAARWLNINLADGSTISMDMLVASGAYPGIYYDFTGRASRFMVRTAGWKAMDLTPYVDVAQYYDLKPWTRDGKLLGVPAQVPLQAIGINLDILKQAGYMMPKDWTTDDFLAMCKAVAKLPGKYGTGLFAKNQSADYLWMNWFGAFGAKVFTGGDYTKTTINSPEGVATVRFLGNLVQAGYAPKDSADQWDDSMLELWQKGLVAAMPIRPDWIEGYMKPAIEQKIIDKAFDYTMVPFPRGPGQKTGPTIGAGSTAVAYDSGNVAVDKATGMLAAALGGKEYQSYAMTSKQWGAWPTRKDVIGAPQITGKDLECWTVVNDILKVAGVMDVGYTLPQYAAIRAEMFPRLAQVYMGKETPEVALSKFEKTVNEILAQ